MFFLRIFKYNRSVDKVLGAVAERLKEGDFDRIETDNYYSTVYFSDGFATWWSCNKYYGYAQDGSVKMTNSSFYNSTFKWDKYMPSWFTCRKLDKYFTKAIVNEVSKSQRIEDQRRSDHE